MTDKDPESYGLNDDDWMTLLDAIENDECTPFLGAGMCAERLPTAGQLAQLLSTEVEYPLSDWNDLASVSQAVALRSSPSRVKHKVLKLLGVHLSQKGQYKPLSANDPHRILAGLPLTLYMTTNYDDFMYRALRDAEKEPIREHCRWYERTAESTWTKVSVEEPMVFHIHGCNETPSSLVLTEDDYLDFLVRLGQRSEMIPPMIQGAIAQSSLLFIGYSLRDWNFRVLHRAVKSQVMISGRMPSFTVQLTPWEWQPGCDVTVHMNNNDKISGEVIAGAPDCYMLKGRTVGKIEIPRNEVHHIEVVNPGDHTLSPMEKAVDCLRDYYGHESIRVFWGTADEFMTQLQKRWIDHEKNKASALMPQHGAQTS